MLNKNATIDFDYPNCKNKLTFTVGQLLSGETTDCPNCHLKINTSEAKKGFLEAEKALQDFKRRFSKKGLI